MANRLRGIRATIVGAIASLFGQAATYVDDPIAIIEPEQIEAFRPVQQYDLRSFANGSNTVFARSTIGSNTPVRLTWPGDRAPWE